VSCAPFKGARNNTSLGIEGGFPGQVERDLAVEGGLGLEERQKHLSQPPQSVHAPVWKVGFQVGG